MTDKIDQMMSFYVKALDKNGWTSQGNDFIFRTGNGDFARLVFHTENTPETLQEIGKAKKITREGEDFIDEDTGDPVTIYKDVYTAHIFYKDNKNFLRNAAQDLRNWKIGNFKGRSGISLKNYTFDQLKDGFKLNKAELAGRSARNLQWFLHMYQPKTNRLEEAARLYHYVPIVLNYDTLRQPSEREDRQIKSKPSKEYALAILASEKNKNLEPWQSDVNRDLILY